MTPDRVEPPETHRPSSGLAAMTDERFTNRELSWIQFNDRVLQLASEQGIPLLERAKFLAIAATNLDEFYQVRVAALKDQIVAGIDQTSPDGRTPAQTLAAVGQQVLDFVDRSDGAFVDELVPELRSAGIDVISWDDVTDDERGELDDWFDDRTRPRHGRGTKNYRGYPCTLHLSPR